MKAAKLIALSILMVAFLVSGLYADENKPVAEVMVGAYGLSWSPNVSYAKLVLSVSAPNGKVFERTFDAGNIPGFDLSNIEGGAIDGYYTYELRVIPVLATSDIGNREKPTIRQASQMKALTQTGTFMVNGGSIVNPNTSEQPIGTKDQVIADDLIVTMSACIGNDCANGENFGYDTLRLKENNLRIRAYDTSNSGSFPTTDWQIIFNSSDNGGGSYFAVQDIDSGRTPFTIEASAPSNSLYVDDGGRVGFGKSTPAVELHVADGDSPTLRLEQDGSSGFTPQTWDVAGNEANFFVRDVTNGSKLPFKIVPGAPTNSLYVANDGNIAFGTATIPTGYTMYLKTPSTDNAVFVAERTNGASLYITATDSQAFMGTVSDHALQIATKGVRKMMITTEGYVGIGSGLTPTHMLEVKNTVTGTNGSANAYCDGGDWINGSSREVKDNIKSLTSKDAMDTLKLLNPVRFHYKFSKEEESLGFIAEDVPELVATKDRKGMSPMDVVAVLTKVVQDQQKSIEELKKEIEELKKK